MSLPILHVTRHASPIKTAGTTFIATTLEPTSANRAAVSSTSCVPGVVVDPEEDVERAVEHVLGHQADDRLVGLRHPERPGENPDPQRDAGDEGAADEQGPRAAQAANRAERPRRQTRSGGPGDGRSHQYVMRLRIESSRFARISAICLPALPSP